MGASLPDGSSRLRLRQTYAIHSRQRLVSLGRHESSPAPIWFRSVHAEFLRRLIEAETLDRRTRAHERRIQAARFPVRKTLDQFKQDQFKWD
jgi:DNA replication protein DnaC